MHSINIEASLFETPLSNPFINRVTYNTLYKLYLLLYHLAKLLAAVAMKALLL